MARGGALALLIALAAGACGSRARIADRPSEPPPTPRVEAEAPPKLRVLVGTCFAWDASRTPGPQASASVPTGAPSPLLGGRPAGPVARRPVRVPSVQPGPHRVSGSIDANVIRRVIRRSLPRIRYCYEKELARNPSLAGRVNTRFTIDATGSVSSATVTGLSPEVAGCVERALRAMKFPKPPGGGIVMVSYPFIFRPGDVEQQPSPPVPVRESLGAPPATAQVLPGCVAVDMPSVLFAREATLDGCFPAGHRHRERWTAIFALGEDGAVTEVDVRGLAHDRARACVRDGLAGVAFPAAGNGDRRVACSFVLDNPTASSVVARADELRVTMADVSLRGTLVADTYALTRDQTESWYVTALGSQLGSRGDARLAVEAHPAVDAVVIERVTRTAHAAGARHLGFARQVGTSGSWMVVNPLGTPDWYCDGARAAIAVRLDPRGVDVTGPGGSERIALRNGEHDFARLRVVLERLRAATPTSARRDLDLSVSRGVAYRALLRALEIAATVGFFDTRLVAWQAPAAQP